MGWTYSHKDDNETPRAYLERNALRWSLPPESHPQIVAHTTNGSTHFFAVRFNAAYQETQGSHFTDYVAAPDGSFTIAVVFLTKTEARDYYNFGYKDMDETSGPYEVCGPRFLDKLSPLKDDCKSYAKDWRQRVREAATAKARADKIADGSRVELPEPLSFRTFKETAFTALTITHRGRNLRCFRSVSTGELVRLSLHHIRNAVITA